MTNEFIRTEMLFGKENIKNLKEKRIAIFGIGGVGSYALEALVRMGVGNIDIIDNDVVSLSNINRQLIALHSTVGQYKVDVAFNRCKDINENCNIKTYKQFYLNNDDQSFDFASYDYVVDAIDTISGKISLVLECQKHNTPIISSMGTGNKIDPTKLCVKDIYKTSVCPLAKVMRRELKRRGVKKLKVVYSEELPKKQDNSIIDKENFSGSRRTIPASCSFVPSTAGLIIASEVIKDLIYGEDKKEYFTGI